MRVERFYLDIVMLDSTNRIYAAVKNMGYDVRVPEADNNCCIAVYRTRALKDGNL